MPALCGKLLVLLFLLHCPLAELACGQIDPDLAALLNEAEQSWIRLASDIGQQEGNVVARIVGRTAPPTKIHFQFRGELQKLTLDAPGAPPTIYVGNDRSFFRVSPTPGDESPYQVVTHHDIEEPRGLGPQIATRTRSIWAPVSVDSIRLDELAEANVKPSSIKELENDKIRLEYSIPGNVTATFSVVVNRANRFAVTEWDLDIGQMIQRKGKVEYGASLGGAYPQIVEISETTQGRNGATVSRYELDVPHFCTADKSEFYEEAFGLTKLTDDSEPRAPWRTHFWLFFRLGLLGLLLALGASLWYRSKRSQAG